MHRCRVFGGHPLPSGITLNHHREAPLRESGRLQSRYGMWHNSKSCHGVCAAYIARRPVGEMCNVTFDSRPLLTMYSLWSLQFLVLALADAVAAFRSTGIKHTSNTRVVRDYLDRLVPASKNAILHELMGPTVGSDVNSYPRSSHTLIF